MHLAAMRLLAAILLLAVLASAKAQDPAPPTALPGKLKVVIKPVKPFAYEEKGEWVGLSVDLWKRVAQEAKLEFEIESAKTATEAIERVGKRQADVAIGALSVTAARAEIVDFSYPFYSSGLQILAPAKGDNSTFAAFRGLLKVETLKVIGVLILALLLNSHILWWLERRRNAESFPEGYRSGLMESTWWSVCTLITGGCENKAPIGLLGRLSAVVWMLAGIGLTAYITATLSATLTVNTLTTDIRGLGDLRNGVVGSVNGSSAATLIANQDLAFQGFDDIETACRALAAGQLRAVIYDAPILRYYLSTNPGTSLQLVGELFEKQKYAFALQERSPHRTAVTLAMVKAEEDGYLDELDKKWFGPAL
jgi:polar amino acid transport system substrate-binding protein